VSLLSSGTCTVSANQAGNASFAAAPAVTNSFPVSPASTSGAHPYVGIGINGLSYYDGSFAMVDLSRESGFAATNWNTTVGPGYQIDANGVPMQDFLMIVTSNKLAAGTYKLSFTGRATLAVSASGSSIQNQIYNAAANKTTADVVFTQVASGNTWLEFSTTRRTAASSTADGVSNISLIRPGYPTDGSAIFTNEFITAMKKFQLIRGMDFFSTNSNPSVAWSDRTKVSFQGTVTSTGQSWELMVLLANTTGNDIWLNVPVQANDDYITKLAQLLKYGSDGTNPYTSVQPNSVYPPLNPGLKVYLEYGNEVWNSGPAFHGFYWAKALANAVRGNASHPIAYDGAITDEWLGHRRWIAYRSSVISLNFRAVFGDAAMMTTVRPILSSQVGNANNYLSDGLIWADGFYGQVRNTAPLNPVVRTAGDIWYGGGGAAYYGSTVSPVNTQAATMDDYFANLPSPNFASTTSMDATWTRAYGLHTIAYEGGPGPGGDSLGGMSSDPTISPTYNADPRMKTRMQVASDVWLANGGEGLSYYVYSASAPWSFVNDQTPNTVSDTNTVKLQAIDAIRANPLPAVTLGTSVPGTVYLRSASSGVQQVGGWNSSWGYQVNGVGTAYRINADTGGNMAKSEGLMVPILSSAGGNFNLSFTTFDAPVGGKLEVLINGRSAGVIDLVASSTGVAVASPSIPVTLPAGLTLVRVRSTAGSIWIRDLLVE
jgi:hypothetical protein